MARTKKHNTLNMISQTLTSLSRIRQQSFSEDTTSLFFNLRPPFNSNYELIMVFHSECKELIAIESSCAIVPNRYEQKGILIS